MLSSRSTTRVLGLDLGQAGDYSAAACGELGSDDDRLPIRKRSRRRKQLRFVALRRWPLGTDYCRVVEDALDLGVESVVVDFTGVGRPVVDLMRRRANERQYAGRIVPVSIVSSSARGRLHHEKRGAYRTVPKVDLISSILLWQQGGLLVLPDVPETKLLLSELANFRMRYTKSANQTYAAAAGSNDDLVLALGLACWWADRCGRRRLAIVC